ncbi:hypothetical protein [Methylobacterium aerolatum]|uniref:Uncharacterized protein n=1 Tax=Methylobacterium aerolatum TaxID=418708 RepID=A0ABU0I260_9HYPH|nr:hypothetical protein [Methylobacterium aerolatum]MDQ0448197.1 hypothetical protein [Methylobacterium aerolatum]GJD33937.1 hypothetical protein FMGBMHLM_0832 [Methylobacterium aerolatum]
MALLPGDAGGPRWDRLAVEGDCRPSSADRGDASAGPFIPWRALLRPFAPLLPALAALALAAIPARAEDAPDIAWPEAEGRASISTTFNGSPITVGVSSRTAGAVDSLTWGGTQFINAYDHGRELQSASSYDGFGECLNPTEAGSNADGAGPTSTSLLTHLGTAPGRLETRTVMAYWMRPGERSENCPKGPGSYGSPRSDDVLAKRITLGAGGVPNAIAYHAAFTTAAAHSQATFEAATAYMPGTFSRFWTYDPATGDLQPLEPGMGEQAKPVILSTPDGSRALGVYSPDLPQKGQNVGYGRFDFSHLPGEGNATVKWNCVFREGAIPAGTYTYTCFALIGTLEDVTAGMSALRTALTGQPGPPHKGAKAVPVEANRETAPFGQEPEADPAREARSGVPLYVGTRPNCNAGIVTVRSDFRRCDTAPIGATSGERTEQTPTPLYVTVSPRGSAGVVTTNPRHLNGTARPIGFVGPGGGGTPLFVGTTPGCNAGVVSTNPAHMNCGGAPIGTASP